MRYRSGNDVRRVSVADPGASEVRPLSLVLTPCPFMGSVEMRGGRTKKKPTRWTAVVT